MIGAAIAIRRNSHLQIDILINLLKPKRAEHILTIIATIWPAWCSWYSCCPVLSSPWCSHRRPHHVMRGLKIPMSIPYASIPVGVALMILTSIEVLLKNISAAARGRPKEVPDQ